ncbi:hypothetical protein Thiowin_00644 [Thiorhodovibrio winogradskyi]|uniref:Uncharacterized protein n=1 Tax=Thiorhodovibrio winogradskyi TaxID=77007 RepID=A0ABZ0S5A0_9GAMM|nr:hypothetical protein [Thiorhodovibrio winogradskyi]
MAEGKQDRSEWINPRLTVPVLTAVLGGLIGGLVADRMAVNQDHPANSILVLSVADWLRGGQDGAAIRTLAERLAEHGFLVLDDQAVLAAPEALFLQPTEVKP